MTTLKLFLLACFLIALSACTHKLSDSVGTTSTSSDGGGAGPAAGDVAGSPDMVSLEEIVVSASKPSRKSRRSKEESIPDTPKNTTDIQSGTITAADYDDQLNRKLYLDYASKFLQKTTTNKLPFLDLHQRITFTIQDANGNSAPGVAVEVFAENKLLKKLKTPANGNVYLYPTYDKLPESFELKVFNKTSKLVANKKLTLSDLEYGSSHIISINESLKSNTQLDLAVVLDTTGSMGDELAYLKKELRAIIINIDEANSNLDIKVGLVVYRDTSDAYVTRKFDFIGVDKLIATLAAQNYNGGGDYPEAMDQALASANSLSWRPQSTKVMLLVADAPPHDEKSQAAWDQAEIARSQQIHILPVGASGVGDKAQYLMRAMAALTQSRYIFLTDDSGVGNKHAEPSVDCYVVTRLDNLITRVINGLIVGKRIEAKNESIVRRKGNYQNGLCTTDEKAPSNAS
jgi:hypothetical protein